MIAIVLATGLIAIGSGTIGDGAEVAVFHKQRVACRGEVYGPGTAAHRTLPCGTKIRATTRYGTVEVRIVDRGRLHPKMVLDVDDESAKLLGLVGPGHLPVQIEVLDR